MANIDQENTATLDLIGLGEDKLSQGSGVVGENASVDDGAAGMRNAGDSKEGKEAETLPRKLSPATMNASDQADNSDLQTAPVPSVSTTPASAVSPSPTRPALVQLNSSQSHSGSSTPTVATAPHPKKFSSININKKFLEKTTPASGAASAMATTSSSMKSSGNGIFMSRCCVIMQLTFSSETTYPNIFTTSPPCNNQTDCNCALPGIGRRLVTTIFHCSCHLHSWCKLAQQHYSRATRFHHNDVDVYASCTSIATSW